jgi:hypothetical protein
MRPHHSKLSLLILLGLANSATAGIGHATVPCIDAHPGLTGAPIFTFYRRDGTSIRRSNAMLEGFDTQAYKLLVNDAGERRALDLAEWGSIEITLRTINPTAQLAPPQMSELLKLSNAKYPLSSMKILDHVISYGDCSATIPSIQEVKFQGKLLFNKADDGLIVDGTFYKVVQPSPSLLNPRTYNPGIKR